MSDAARYPTWLSIAAGLSIAAIIAFGVFVIWITAMLSAPPPVMWAQIIALWLVFPLLMTIGFVRVGARLIERGRTAAGTALSLAPLAIFALIACWQWFR